MLNKRDISKIGQPGIHIKNKLCLQSYDMICCISTEGQSARKRASTPFMNKTLATSVFTLIHIWIPIAYD